MTDDRVTMNPAGTAGDAVPVDVIRPSAGNTASPAPFLLAVDCGLRTGLALFGSDGRLIWYRSHHLGSRSQLRRAAARILGELPGLGQLVVEGGGTLAEVWVSEGRRREIATRIVQAEQWRGALLLPRQQRSGRQAKQAAGQLARAVIDRSGAARPTALRHDAAEAILLGWWAIAGRPDGGSFEKPGAGAKMKNPLTPNGRA